MIVTRTLARLPKSSLSQKIFISRQISKFSTMTIYSSAPAAEQSSTLSSGYIINNKPEMLDLMYTPYHMPQGAAAHIPTAEVFGLETHLSEAAALAKSNSNIVDKVVLFISHGEVTQCESDGNVNASLTGKGIGQALNVSREISHFCNKNTGLVPQLYVVSPLRCTTESALLASPQYAPGNVNNVSWICHDKCIDFDHDLGSIAHTIDECKSAFPGVNYDLMRERSSESFLSWLTQRQEKVIVVSSTKSWIDSFINMYAPTQTTEKQDREPRLLRSIGIKIYK